MRVSATTDPGGITAVFFDLGDTLGTATVGGHPLHLTRFDVFPFVSALLAGLKARALPLGVISNTGGETGTAVNAVLQPTGLLTHLDPGLLVYSGDQPDRVTKASVEIFHRAADRAGQPAARCLYVGEDAAERVVAIAAGWNVCPHPLLVEEVLAGQQLRYVRLTVPAAHTAAPWRDELRKRAFVPQHFAGPHGTTVYGLTSQRVALELIHMRFGVELLGEPDLPRATDLYLLRDDLAQRTGFLSAAGAAARAFADVESDRLIVSSTAEGVVAALPGGRGPDEFHFDEARHGHNLKLTPDPLLWDVAPSAAAPVALAGPRTLSPAAAAALAQIDPATVLRTVQRYSGLAALDGSETGPRVRSRHVLVDDGGNGRAVEQLARDLEAIGLGRFQVQLHPFTFAGRTLHNVEAELPGRSPELVLVTAHLDSTASSDDDFDPRSGQAPGADDDASGVAGVLAIAGWFAALAEDGPLPRTIRFVLFNAEEQGLVGSKAYARRSKSRGEVIAAVWQMDMIGYNETPSRDWEVHAGFEPSPAVEARSRRLAEVLAAVVPVAAATLPAPQVLHSDSATGDPAAGRSDHASFQAQGYPACVVSEDFFIDEPDGPAPDANPNYHRSGDMVIDSAYAADLARAVAAAAWMTVSEPISN